MEQQSDYITPFLADVNTKLGDLEEKQRLLKERVLLIGENLVSSRDETKKELAELKVFAESAKKDILKIRETLSRILEDLESRARKQEIDLLKRQAKMFQPLELVTREELKNILKGGK